MGASRRAVVPLLLLCGLCALYLHVVPSSPTLSLRSSQTELAEHEQFSGEGQDGTSSWTPGRGGGIDYRQHLERTTSPAGYTHSRTLGFTGIYVLSLPTRPERRERMETIAQALGLDFTFVEATPAESSVLRWIAQRVKEVREEKVEILVKKGWSRAGVGGGGVNSPWLMGREELRASGQKEQRFGGRTWVDYLDELTEEEARGLDADSPTFDINKELYDVKTSVGEQLTPAVLAAWHSHTKLLKRMREDGDNDALILEDDVDLEWDVERMWATAKRRLPENWDAVYLGHCWGKEMTKPIYLHPSLHEATLPRCLHAYAVSRLGAGTLRGSLSDPWLAFQGPVDTALASLISRDLVHAFSMQPPLVIQSKDLASDVAIGTTSNRKGASREAGGGNEWGGFLGDSTWLRVLKDRGSEVPEPTFDVSDPAIHYRAGRPTSRPPKAGAAARPIPRPPPIVQAPMDNLAAPGQPLVAVNHPADVKAPPPPAPFAQDEFDTPPPRQGAPPPKKIGTGGKFVGKKQAMHAAAPVEDGRTAVTEEAKKEAGKRVGTGARPGAKGMALGPPRGAAKVVV